MFTSRWLFLALAIPFALSAREPELRLTWNQLNAWTGPSARVRILTPDKVTLEGQIIRVEDQTLLLRILNSSDKKKIGLGERSLDRAQVSSLSLRREITNGRKRGALVGAILGGVLGGLSGSIADTASSPAAGAAVGAIGNAAIWGGVGYLWGRSIDRVWTPVTLTP